MRQWVANGLNDFVGWRRKTGCSRLLMGTKAIVAIDDRTAESQKIGLPTTEIHG